MLSAESEATSCLSDKNLRFYSNQLRFQPDGCLIDEFHQTWFQDYTRLEREHCYIQWLFPIRQPGLNEFAQPLLQHEIDVMMTSPEIEQRLILSYELMLDFYGLQLVNVQTGEVADSPNSDKRMRHLNRSGHNCLRITRILSCLGELGLERFMKPLVLKLIIESHTEGGRLKSTASSCRNYWVPTLSNDTQRSDMQRLCEQLRKTSESHLGATEHSDQSPPDPKGAKGVFKCSVM